MDIKTMGGSWQALNGGAPEISIIIVTLNAGSFLENCLTSIIEQSYQKIEIIVFDGGSHDDTLQVINRYSKYISHWRSEPDEGIYDAMNKAVRFATGRWVHFLGADDQLLPGFSDLAQKLADPDTIYYGDMSYNGEATQRKEYSAYRLAKETICHQAIVYPRRVFDEYQYDLRYPLAADWALNLHLWADKRFTFRFYPFLVADFSLAGASTLKRDENFLNDHPVLVKETLGWPVYLRLMLKKFKKRIKGGP